MPQIRLRVDPVNYLFKVIRPNEAGNWAEGFLFRNKHVRVDVFEDGGGEEIPVGIILCLYVSTVKYDLSAFLQPALYPF